ncbi:PREDICTED: protein transport protein sft2 [Nicrophorus vespilloides]|uniref:Vesicle transport protein n=1 Tax=Nicrophorus vespilloides TaxID=110193 RepID=A0ABM1M795_NICVS|nr:PREDICTED: protein transport protein sft2 [Nicrophorus vespilloides]
MDLKKDLDQYLLLQSNQKKSFKITLPNIQKPSILNNLLRKEEPEEEGWFQETKKSCCPSLTRMQRIIGFGVCLGMGILCFTLSAMFIPVLLFKARRFSLLFTLGSSFFLMSFSFLWGPMNFFKMLFSKDRLLLSLTYILTLVATLYAALSYQSTPFTVLFAVGQVITLLWMVVINIPGGSTGISMFGRMFSYGVSNTLPI